MYATGTIYSPKLGREKADTFSPGSEGGPLSSISPNKKRTHLPPEDLSQK